MDFGPLLVEKSVLGVIAVERILDPARGQLAFQAINGIGRTPVVLIGEMAQEGHPDLRGVRRFDGGNAIKANRRVQLGNLHPRDDGDGASHAESQHRGLSAAGLEVLDGPPHVLSGSPGPVQARHHMAGLVRTLGDPPPVEGRHPGAVSPPARPGGRALGARPNGVPVSIGEPPTGPATILLIQTNIDDMSPELFGYAQERLFDAGAADVWVMPIQMKKNRPGMLLSVLCPAELEGAMVDILLRETTTLGVRVKEVSRHEAERESLEFESSLGPAAVKVKRLPGRPPVAAPEYEPCARIAREQNPPLAEVYRSVEAEALEHLAGS